jgi:hypothetical protein
MNPYGRPPQTANCGHPNQKHYAKGLCRPCYEKARDAANPERRRDVAKKRYQKDPELWKARAKNWVDNNPVKYLLRTARQSARTRNLSFDLDAPYLQTLWTTTCPILGLQLVRVAGTRDTSPSLDRIDPASGYIRGNVQIISFRANRIKNDATVEELEAITRFLRLRAQTS